MSSASAFLPGDEAQAPTELVELHHKSHQHMLLYEPAENLWGSDKNYKKCALCDQFTFTSDCRYSCERCNFYIHKLCAQIPDYVCISFHPDHFLELISVKDHDTGIICCCCEGEISTPLRYMCTSNTTSSACDFVLHTECAAKTTFDPKHQQHSFIHFKPTLFTCDACGADNDTQRPSLVCTICQLQVHIACSKFFPLTSIIKQRMHRHELILCFAFEIDFEFVNKFCKICSQKMNRVLCLYQCNGGCGLYIAHASCAARRDYLINDTDHYEDNVILHHTPEDQEDHITHFSHPHSLILTSIAPEDTAILCYGCVRPISVPFYTCGSEQCNFYLHQQCFQLPHTIQSAVHQHPLELKDFIQLDTGDIIFHGFTCGACQVRSNGFAYACPTCHETFEVGCASFGDTLNHPSHKCTLTLMSTNEEKRCIACDSTFTTAFWCEECNFFLDLKCASMPTTIGHDCPTGTVWSIKPLKLWYDCIEHAGGQYYCDLCEETRSKDLWFYHCEDCHDCIHPQCLLGEDMFRYGKYCNIGHCHTVRVVEKPKTDPPLCDTCGKPCQNSPLVFCPTCKVYIHGNVDCCGIPTKSKPRWPVMDCWCGSSSNSNEDGDEDNDENARETAIEGGVKHFSHPHSLQITEYDPEKSYTNSMVCDGCVMPIFTPFFYACADKKGECRDFFLHKECFELPEQISTHPWHPDHPLILNSFFNLPWEDGVVGFTCYACGVSSNGYVYACLACKFFLDVRCSLMTDTLVYERHECTLSLVDKKMQSAKGEARKCNECNSACSSCVYVCDECNFEIDLYCASLPKQGLHKCCEHNWEERPHQLGYGVATEDGEYRSTQCFECSLPIGENEGNYYCRVCERATHARCLASRFNLIKTWIGYRAYNHIHKLVTYRMDGECQDCDACLVRIEAGPALHCEICEVYFHLRCCRQLTRA